MTLLKHVVFTYSMKTTFFKIDISETEYKFSVEKNKLLLINYSKYVNMVKMHKKPNDY